jgi:hypothetical protein
MKRFRKVIAWTFLIGGLAGFTLSAFQVIAKDEPLIVLLLSWAALVYEGFNSVVLTEDNE